MDSGYNFNIIFPHKHFTKKGTFIKYIDNVKCTCAMIWFCFPLGTIDDVKILLVFILYYLELAGPYFVNGNSILVTML